MDGRYEKIKVEHVIGERSAQVIIKDVITVPQPKPDPDKIISIDKTVKVTDIEVIRNKVIIDGLLNMQLVYVACLPDQPVHHTHGKVEFTQFVELPDVEPGMMARVSVKVEDIQATVDRHAAGKIQVIAVLQLTVKVTETKEINVLVEPPSGVTAQKETLRVEEVVGEGKSQAVVSGRFKIPQEKPAVEKVLDVDASVTITDKKILDGKVIIEGDLDLQFIYVALEATQPVHHFHGSMHFTQFVEVEGAEEDDVHIQVEEMITYIGFEVINAETVGAEVIIDKVVKVTRTRELEVVTDIEGKDVEKETLKVEHVVGEEHVQVVIREQVDVPPEKPAVVKILDVIVHKVEVLEEEIVIIKDKVVIGGFIDVQVLYVGEGPDQSVHQTEAVLKFRQFVPIAGAKPDQTVLVNTVVEHATARVGECGGSLTFEVVLKITARLVETIEIEVVVAVEVPPDEVCEPGEIINYVVQKGDTFFLIAQRYNTSAASITRLNPGVDPNNLQVGMTIKVPCDC